MDRQSISVLSDYLATQRRVWVRLAATPNDNGVMELSLLEVTTGDPPPTWRRQRWNYPRAVFIASTPAGITVARWLNRQRISLPSLSIRISLQGTVGVERRASGFQGICEQLPWPSCEWKVHLTDSGSHTQHGELLASNAPAFFNFDLAAAAFFGVSLEPSRNFSGREIVVRQQDLRARIDEVLVRPTGLVVGVSGKQLRGVSLTLSGAEGPSRSLSQRSRKVRLPLLKGLVPNAWLALHRDYELLDRRILGPAWGAKDLDVEIDASTRVEVLISGGERAAVEFKQELPGSNPAGVMKTIAAFANAGGGTLLFGVHDDGLIVGVGDYYTRRSLDRLTNLIRDWVRPLPSFECEMVRVAGRGVIAINVASGNDAPYGIGKDERDIRYYVRRAGTTFPASPADVRAFVQARVRAAPASPYVRSRRR